MGISNVQRCNTVCAVYPSFLYSSSRIIPLPDCDCSPILFTDCKIKRFVKFEKYLFIESL